MLLPSPTTSDANGAGAHGDGGADLRTTVAHDLMPTPVGGGNALPTWEPPTGASGYLSSPGLLPTPQADTSTTLQHGKPALQAICIELKQTAPM